jgi:hypothetical protein
MAADKIDKLEEKFAKDGEPDRSAVGDQMRSGNQRK